MLFLIKKAFCRYGIWFLVKNVLSFYTKFCRVLLATIVETFISISYNLLVLVQIFDCQNCLKFACLKVAKQRDFLLFLFRLFVCLFCRGFGTLDVLHWINFWNLSPLIWPLWTFLLSLPNYTLSNNFAIFLHSSRDKEKISAYLENLSFHYVVTFAVLLLLAI